MNIRNRSFCNGRGAAALAVALCLAAGAASGATTTTVDYLVEYIQSSGTQWIDTGVLGKSTVNVAIDVKVLSCAGSGCLIGERSANNATDKFAIWFNQSQGKPAINHGSLDSSWQGSSITGARHVISNENSRLYCDDTRIYNGATQTFSSSLTMTMLFLRTSATALDNASTRNLSAQIYGAKIYDGDVLVRDFQPCRATISDTESGTSVAKYGLWDYVEKRFYGDLSGGTDFTAGDRIEAAGHPTRLSIGATPESIATASLSPSYGDHDGYASGTPVTASAPSGTIQVSDAKRATVAGGTFYTIDPVTHCRDDGVPFIGTSYMYTADGKWHEIEWRWDVECLVTSRAGANGSVSASEWVGYGEVATVTATPAAGYALGKWDGPLGSLRDKSNPLRFVVTGPVTNTAVFYPVVHVSPTGSDSNNGTSWSDAFLTISAAVGSRDMPYVLVSNGTYGVSTDITIDKPAVVASLTGNPDDVKVRRASGNIHIFNLNHADAVVRGVAIQDGYFSGYAFQGPGVYIGAGGGAVEDCVVRNCTVSGDSTRGAIYMNSDYGRVSRCVISNCVCTASSQGGAAISMAKGLVENCLVTRNQYNDSNSSHDRGVVTISGGTLQSCTIAGNSGKYFAGVCAANAAASISDCIIGGNTLSLSQTEANAVSCNNPASFVNCLAPVQINGTCRTGDLGFQNAAAYDFHITAASAALDAASPAAAAFLSDLDGFPRPSGAGPDIGCYEYDSSTASIALVADATEGLAPFAVHFSIKAVGLSGAASYAWDLDGDGTADETTAAPTLTHTFQTSGSFAVSVSALDALGAVLAASANTVTIGAYPATVYVNASSATPAAPYDTPATAATTLQAALGATIGGATALVADGAYPLTATVLIDKGVRVVGNDGDPSRVVFRRSGNANFRLFTLNHPDAVLSGVTLEGGRLNSSGECGANLMVSSLGGTATNCVIRGGYADGYNGGGGGVHIVAGATAGLVTHCVITNNGASVTASDCNESRSGGAGVNIAGGTVRNCLVAYNYQNTANTLGKLFGGGAIVRGGTLESCTVANNSARICAGVYATAGSVLNCAIANNTPTASETEQYTVWAGDASLFSHCVSPVSINANCIVEAAPLTAPGAGDFTPAAGSHAIDAAAEAAWMTGAKDLAGNARIQGEGPDIGAYEADAAAFAASFSADIDTGFAPLAVNFAFTAVNGGGAGYALEWYEEGESVPYSTTRVQGDAATIAQTFADVGSHNVVLKVEDLATGAAFTVPGYVTIYAAPRTVHVVPAGTPGAAPAAPYADWATAATDVGAALKAAIPGAEVVLSNGVHQSAELWYLDKAVTVRGLTGDPADVEIRLAGATLHRAFALSHAGALLAGVTIDGMGIGHYLDSAALLSLYNGGGTVSNCVLRNARSTKFGATGGAVLLNSPTAVLTHCVLTNNTLWCSSSGIGNGQERGIAAYVADGRMENCLVAFNAMSEGASSTQEAGGAIAVAGGLVANCTVVANAHKDCAGVYAMGGTVANTIVAGNDSTLLGGDAAVYRGDASRFVRCVSDTVRINASCALGDLAFRNAAAGDFAPRSTSAAVNAGDNAYSSEATDLRGMPRRIGRVDAGCYECQGGAMTILLLH